MAASSQSKGIASFGKRFVTQAWTKGARDPTPASALTVRRSAHIPAYDKNLDDEVRPTVVPGHVIEAQSENYWAPHPRTGVFGPATDQGGDQVILSSPAENGGTELVLEQKKGSESVLEQKAWFRPLEDVEMPRPHP